MSRGVRASVLKSLKQSEMSKNICFSMHQKSENGVCEEQNSLKLY